MVTVAASKIPSLSVFIPTYNGGKFLREAIESVLDNGFPDLEVLVIDDASTDSTVEIVESIRHPALRLMRNATNIGVAATRRHSIEHLRGRYLALLDQDDIAVRGRFESQINRLATMDGPDIIGGAVEFFGDERRIKHCLCSDAEIRTGLLFGATMVNPAICMKLDPLRDGRLRYSVEAGPAADYALWVDAMNLGLRLENLPGIVTRYRRHDMTMTHTMLGPMLERAQAVRQGVVDGYFPMFHAAERAALADALSNLPTVGERWSNGIYALSHAASLAHTIPGIDSGLMVNMLGNCVITMVRLAVKRGKTDYQTFTKMTLANPYLDMWCAAEQGALGAHIKTLFC